MSYQVFFLPTGLSMNIAAAWPQCLDFFGTPLVIEPSLGKLSGGNRPPSSPGVTAHPVLLLGADAGLWAA
jgi:hypothetical protein